MGRSFLVVTICAALIAGLAAAPASAAKGKRAKGKVTVTVSTPKGVPANVLLRRGAVSRVAAKAAKGRRAKVRLSLPARRYRIAARPFAFKGRFYVGKASRRKVRVARGRTARVRVRYRRVPSASKLRPKRVTASRVALAWRGPKRARFALRRAVGSDAPTGRRKGVAVRTKGRRAVDRGLKAGTRYSYSLFTKLRGRRWTGPIAVSAGTLPRPGSTDAAFVTSPGTVLARPRDIAHAATTGDGVALRLKGRGGPPVIGTVVALPRSAALPGGFLGRVVSIRADGTAVLAATGLDAAFDAYSIEVPRFQDAPQPVGPEAAARASRAGSPPRATLAKYECGGGNLSSAVTLKPSIGVGGHFSATIDKFSIFGKEIPKGATLDMELTATATAAADVKASGSTSCHRKLPSVTRPLTLSPVPISFHFAPTAGVSVNGSAEVTDIGATATAGFRFSGSFGVTDGVHVNGSPILTASTLQPKGAIEATIGATLGGEVVVGPGAGTPAAGVIAGVGGKLNPIDASFGSVFAANDKRHGSCLKTDAAFTRELNLTAKAWVAGWSVNHSVTFDFLKGATQYGGTPWYWPTDCTQLAADPQDPGDSVLGDGVQVVDDTTVGGPEQVGRVEGFVPGSETWVLSTGRIADAIGTPDAFASTEIGTPGDADLSALSGWPTYDAAGYEVRLVPQGDQLHVKYVFASEEYPEFVGSEFNDVMRVLVDGQNCALVPGTSNPVSVNTVNQSTQSEYYVDNETGAAGYSTSMDGLTVPLTCHANVTPGQEVTVKIAVADSSDGIYDSAVALVDKGIWSD